MKKLKTGTPSPSLTHVAVLKQQSAVHALFHNCKCKHEFVSCWILATWQHHRALILDFSGPATQQGPDLGF